MASKRPLFLAVVLTATLGGCGRDENSPDMGAVAPKPNLGAAANAPGGAQPGSGADPAQGLTANGRKP